ncbi:hypothetical protein Taro_032168 [Colocasia esculenta]|uniref:Uncharacterized protein n=1 Tax=Colocasia esculenta TaxID=4460 RepID=A0A843VU32_COLES|nr:hypothetical protein [Colocasia esculenta]
MGSGKIHLRITGPDLPARIGTISSPPTETLNFRVLPTSVHRHPLAAASILSASETTDVFAQGRPSTGLSGKFMRRWSSSSGVVFTKRRASTQLNSNPVAAVLAGDASLERSDGSLLWAASSRFGWHRRQRMHLGGGSNKRGEHSEKITGSAQMAEGSSNVDQHRYVTGSWCLAVLRTGAATAASGSAYAEFGSTKVIVSVFGPRESKKAMKYSDIGRLNCNVSFTTFSTPTRGQESNHKEFSSMLHKALEGAVILETFPKTTVDVFALVLESGGSDLPVIISCASLALADAGIMMYDLVTSVSVTCIGKSLIIDPTAEEEDCQDASLMLTSMPSRNEITQLTLTGEWSTGRIHEATELCLDACLKLGEIMRACLRETASSSN